MNSSHTTVLLLLVVVLCLLLQVKKEEEHYSNVRSKEKIVAKGKVREYLSRAIFLPRSQRIAFGPKLQNPFFNMPRGFCLSIYYKKNNPGTQYIDSGAVCVGNRYILTAHHCEPSSDNDWSHLYVACGGVPDTANPAAFLVERKVWSPKPMYDGGINGYDVALLRVRKVVGDGKGVGFHQAKITTNTPLIGRVLRFCGFGMAGKEAARNDGKWEEDPQLSGVARCIDVRVRAKGHLFDGIINRWHKAEGVIETRTVDVKNALTPGDSGSPLFGRGGDVIGIMTGSNFNHPSAPGNGIFVDLSYWRNNIKKAMQRDSGNNGTSKRR